MSLRNHRVPLAESQGNVVNPANSRSALNDGVEHWLHVGWRAADDAEQLGRCRLMLQGLAQLCVALLEFFEEANILDSDNGLRGEGFEKFDLLLRERPHLRSAKANYTYRNALSKERCAENGPMTKAFLRCFRV